ncbi:ABC transporter permease subunit [Iocasia frigidifontis]|uniref:ABC transporter permease subunit n=1 Tax=Iocasia fonsfrigidae TaxID=2682810 RepID=A0A8A7KHZ7_9FIRM|nr:sugar ABC transporter permease [Iocasia fonsfrigidae]QTL97502.1 ABC transporter permease subunit [Iocasia fonsfrigidae]
MIRLSKLKPYVMVAPALSFFLMFFIYPIFYMIRLSVTSWNFISPQKEFIGFNNYIELFTSEEFYQVLYNTLIYTVLTVGFSLVLAVLLALWLNKQGTLYNIVQGAIFSPYIISLVSVALLWLWMMDPQYGLLNVVLELMGLPKSLWLTHPNTALFSLVIVGVWKVLGYNTLIVMAGLQSIPKDIYEAAELDESNKWTTFYKITLPMLSPTIFFLLIVSTISSFQVFDTVQVMTQGGPINSTNMLVYYIFQYGFDFFKIGYASAAGVVLLVIVGIMTIFHFMFLSKHVYYR